MLRGFRFLLGSRSGRRIRPPEVSVATSVPARAGETFTSLAAGPIGPRPGLLLRIQQVTGSRWLGWKSASGEDRRAGACAGEAERQEIEWPARKRWRRRHESFHCVEGHGLSWPREKASTGSQGIGVGLALSGRDGARPSRGKTNGGPWSPVAARRRSCVAGAHPLD